MAGVFVTVDEGIAALFGKQRSAKWRALVAGACAGPALLLTGSRNRHYSLATYVLLRGLTLLVRCGNRSDSHPLLRRLLAPTRLQHGDTMLMCLSACQILYSILMMPSTLPPAYVRFIHKQGAKDPHVWQGIRELAARTAAHKPPGPLISLQRTPHASSTQPIPCHFLHPGQGCAAHAVSMVPGGYARALSVYLPVYIVPAILVHRQRLLRDPLPIASKVALGVGRSSLFLSLYVALAMGAACAAHRTTGRSTGALLASCVWVGGLATLVEKKSRRMELAYYCCSRALEAFARCLMEWGCLRGTALRFDVALFSLAVASITHCYSDDCGKHRAVFRSKYLNVLDFIFGNTGLEQGAIKHVPSNLELLTRGVKSMSRNSLTALHEEAESGAMVRAPSAPSPPS